MLKKKKVKTEVSSFLPKIMLFGIIIAIVLGIFVYLYSIGLQASSQAAARRCNKTTNAQGECIYICKTNEGNITIKCSAVGAGAGGAGGANDQKEKKTGCKRVSVPCNNEGHTGNCMETVCDGE